MIELIFTPRDKEKDPALTLLVDDINTFCYSGEEARLIFVLLEMKKDVNSINRAKESLSEEKIKVAYVISSSLDLIIKKHGC
jgi:hypothetical protein